jgi:hypothetical protein
MYKIYHLKIKKSNYFVAQLIIKQYISTGTDNILNLGIEVFMFFTEEDLKEELYGTPESNTLTEDLKSKTEYIYNHINHIEDDDPEMDEEVVKDWLLEVNEKSDISTFSPEQLLDAFKEEMVCSRCNKIDTQCTCDD